MPLSLSLETRSSTLATLLPAARLGGSETETTSSRGATSTPKSATGITVNCFLRAIWDRDIYI